MKWLKKFFKLSNHEVDEYEARNGSNDYEGYKSREQVEDEDLDHAIALSLSEADQVKHSVDLHPHVDGDEDLARALQASLDLEEPSPCPSASRILNVSAGRRVCEGCKEEIGYGRFLSCMGSVWHPSCFRCYACDLPISDQEFSMCRNNPFHKSCYKELFHPKCDVCKQFIPTNATGLIEYRAHPFWLQKYCPSHEMDSTPRCCSCERVESKDAQYIALEDGRKLCLECLDSAIMDTGECQPLYHSIRDFYAGMNMKLDQEIPMLLVQREALNEAMEGEKEGHHHMPETRGLCLSEEQTVNIIFRKPKIGAGKNIIDMRTESQKLTRHCEVTAILVLYGLPRNSHLTYSDPSHSEASFGLLTGSILAHELMHAWLRLNGFRNLEPDVEEGICQVVAHMWLDSEVTAGAGPSSSSSTSKQHKGPKSSVEKKLGEFFLHQIAMDSSPVYGDGFRAGHASMLQFGLRRTLEHIRMTGNFPLQ